jgi:hypothetical protein
LTVLNVVFFTVESIIFLRKRNCVLSTLLDIHFNQIEAFLLLININLDVGELKAISIFANLESTVALFEIIDTHPE